MQTLQTQQTLNEKSIRFEALQQLREIQANMVGVSFLPVIGIMKENNPYIKNIIEFQDRLDDLTIDVQKFISDAKNGVDYTPAEEEGEEEPEEGEEGEEELEPEEGEEEEKKPKKKVEDSSEPEEE